MKNNILWKKTLRLRERLEDLKLRGNLSDTRRAQYRLKKWIEYFKIADDENTFWQEVSQIGIETYEELLYLLGETNEGLQRIKGQEPCWVQEFQQLLSSTIKPSQLNFDEDKDRLKTSNEFGFTDLLDVFVRYAEQSLLNKVNQDASILNNFPLDINNVIRLLSPQLFSSLFISISPTLILELHSEKLRGNLKGDTSKERFSSFILQLMSTDMIDLFNDYPVIAKYFMDCISTWIDSSLEFLARLKNDWEAIQSTFLGGKTEQTHKVKAIYSAGDSHKNGRCVQIIILDNNVKFVYKPKKLNVDVNFQKLLEWINNSSPDVLDFKLMKIIDCYDYGWVEFIEAQSSISDYEAQRFYERLGNYSAILYVLRGIDAHYENLIICGEYPVLVDLETLLHPSINSFNSIELYKGYSLKLNNILSHSILNTGILPVRSGNENDSQNLEVSIFSYIWDRIQWTEQLSLENIEEDNMSLIRGKELVKPRGSSSTLLMGLQKVENYRELFIEGFTKTYGFFERNKFELLKDLGPIQEFKDSTIRVVLQGTYFYSQLLRESFHPHLMQDALDREIHFYYLYADREKTINSCKLANYECDELYQGDIPVFHTTPGSRNLLLGNGDIIEKFFPETSLELVKERIKQLGPEDFERQVWLVKTSFSIWDQASYGASRIFEQPTLNKLTAIEAALLIAERIKSLKISDVEEAVWLDLKIGENHKFFYPDLIHLDLYAGLSGIALFMAHLGRITKEAHYTELARNIVETIRGILDQDTSIKKQLGIGAFTGLSGVIYMLSHVAKIWDENALLDYGIGLTREIRNYISGDNQFDIIGGSAGAILCILALYHHYPVDDLLRAAIQCGEHLLQNAIYERDYAVWKHPLSDMPLTGYAHGTAGIATALSRLFTVTLDNRFHELAIKAINYERHTYSPSEANWPDLRSSSYDYPVLWCHGAAGIGMSRINMIEEIDDIRINEELKIALQTTISKGFILDRNHSLCHGFLGNLDFLLQVHQKSNLINIEDEVENLKDQIINLLISNGAISGNPLHLETVGFMTGLAGIGYGLLRLHNSVTIPSVLALDPLYSVD